MADDGDVYGSVMILSRGTCVVGLAETLDMRKAQCEQLLRLLIEANPASFDAALATELPIAHGLYAISMIDAPEGEYLHAGKTKRGRSGLRGRVWDQHYQTGGSAGDLIEKLKARRYGVNAREAREYITQNCQVRWIVGEDDILRGWAEHYVLAVLRPIWCS